MKREIITTLAVATLWCAVSNMASAQFNLGQPPPRVRPSVSPAINLGQGGAYSYYGLVKPQADATRSIMELQQTLGRLNPDGSLQGQIDQQKTSALGGLQTGHPVTFMNLGHYFPMVPPGGSGANNAAVAGIGQGLGGYAPGAYPAGVGTPGMRTFYNPTFNQGFRP